nr:MULTISPECIES: ABC transporter permease subunit [Gilliamella]
MQGYSLLIFQGALITIGLAIASLVVAVLLGVVCALGKLSHLKTLRLICQIYTSVIRGVPDLVLMMLIFFGLQFAVNNITDFFNADIIEVNPFVAGILTLGFIYGAYFTETFRGAYQAVSKNTLNAAVALGFSQMQVFRYVMFPLRCVLRFLVWLIIGSLY